MFGGKVYSENWFRWHCPRSGCTLGVGTFLGDMKFNRYTKLKWFRMATDDLSHNMAKNQFDNHNYLIKIPKVSQQTYIVSSTVTGMNTHRGGFLFPRRF